MADRPLHLVIDAVCKIAPDIEPDLRWLRQHVLYQPPEMMHECWYMFCTTMQKFSKHPKKQELSDLIQAKTPLEDILCER